MFRPYRGFDDRKCRSNIGEKDNRNIKHYLTQPPTSSPKR